MQYNNLNLQLHLLRAKLVHMYPAWTKIKYNQKAKRDRTVTQPNKCTNNDEKYQETMDETA